MCVRRRCVAVQFEQIDAWSATNNERETRGRASTEKVMTDAVTGRPRNEHSLGLSASDVGICHSRACMSAGQTPTRIADGLCFKAVSQMSVESGKDLNVRVKYS